MTGECVGDDEAAILIAYGSNLSSGTRSASQSLRHLVKALQERGLIVNKISRLWASQAWPNPSDPGFVNAVIDVRTFLEPIELMDLLHEVEAEFGRVRGRIRNAPRTLDLDLIAYGRAVTETIGGLVLPHPRAADRAFVMGPLAEILPGWVHPVLGRTARDLLAAASVGRDAHPVADEA